MTWIQLLAAFGLVLANGFFVASEFAIARVRPTQVGAWIDENRPGARSVEHAVTHIDAYLAACQLGITLASLGLGVVGERAFHDVFESLLGDGSELLGIGLAGAMAFGLITLLHVVVGELAPKSAAISRTGPIVRQLAPPMRAFYLLTKPLVDFFNGLGNLLLKPFGIPPASEAGHTPHSEDELRTIVKQSSREGLIQEDEGTYTDNALTFGDHRVREIMVPRPDVEFVTTDLGLRDVIARIEATGHTRVPLCRPDGGLDAAVGVLHAKDLLPTLGGAPGDELRIESLAREVEVVPDSLLLNELLEQLRGKRQHLALVADEHGTVTGLVTMEDVLEEIVGEIEDEFDPLEDEQITVDGDRTRVAGSAPVRRVAEALGIELDDPHEATIGGYIVERLGRMPEIGETVVLDGREFEVNAATPTRIEELRTSPVP